MRFVQDFSGTAFLQSDPDTVFTARVRVDLNRISIDADGTEIGSWRHDAVAVSPVKDKVHLTADGETLVIDLEGQEFFLDLLGVQKPDVGGDEFFPDFRMAAPKAICAD